MKNVLLIDDNMLVLRVFELIALPFELTTLTTLPDVDKFDTSQYEAIVCDWNMPGVLQSDILHFLANSDCPTYLHTASTLEELPKLPPNVTYVEKSGTYGELRANLQDLYNLLKLIKGGT